jgi:uncharacterized membrane protein YphA (DoxX/SURF4 family)
MSALYGPLAVASLLLIIAGIAKVRQPQQTAVAMRDLGVPGGGSTAARALGLGEVVLGAAALLTGARPVAALVAATYAVFALVIVRTGRDRRLADCGCFGATVTPPSPLHAATNVVLAASATTAAAVGVPSLGELLGEQPWAGLPYVALLVVTTYLVRVVVTDLASVAFGGNHA